MSAFDILYRQKVTLFNRYQSGDSVMWIPTVLDKVHLITAKAIMVAQYGDNVSDNAQLNVRFVPETNGDFIQGKKYYPQKEWKLLSLANAKTSITFAAGAEFDFIYGGAWTDSVVDDDDYDVGFFNYMNNRYDDVYAITNVAKYDFIPHFEITAK